MSKKKNTSRRDFLKMAATSSLAVGAAPAVLASEQGELSRKKPLYSGSPNDTIRLATIGMGGMGFGDTRTALRVPGTELVAAADCYDGRLTRTKEVFGQQVATTRDYREILNRSDIDAVIVATPDHWHSKIATDAMRAGKAVYCEKPMVQKIDQAAGMIQAEQETGQVLQVGSQYVSSMLYEKVKELYQSGAIGELNMVEAWINRNSATGAWQYSIPPNASPETVDWNRFLGSAPNRSFDPKRFFRWRNYWDYGTGIPGDLFVHLFSALHYVLDSNGPNQVQATGGLRYWKDGRDVPDVMLGLCQYPETNTHPPFTLSLQVDFADGSKSGSGFRFIGNEGMLDINLYGSVTLKRTKPRSQPGYTIHTFPEKVQEQFLKEYRERYPEPESPRFNASSEESYSTPGGYDMRLDHFKNFFASMRSGRPVVEDATYGLRAAAPALLCNRSYQDNKIYRWDPDAMQILT